MRGIVIVLALVGGLSLLTSCDKGTGGSNAKSSSASTSGGMPNIAVIPKGTTHVFWRSVHAGAEQAGKELGANIIWKGPLEENDRSQQIQIVEQFVSDRISAICLAPLDDTALLKPVQEAGAQKIPVVIFDSALKATPSKDYVSFVATDNEKGGRLAGEELARLLNGKGKVVLLRYAEGSASTMEREKGFLDVLGQHPDIHLIVENRYGGATVDTAQTAAMNMLDQVKEADGIFCPNESTTLGMLLAIRQAGLTNKAKFVGFDASPKLVEALKANEIQALVSQNPRKIGYEAVKAAIEALHGQTVPQRIDTGVQLITNANVNTPEIQQLLAQP
jgi:ribose transport system substrate-binding protein